MAILYAAEADEAAQWRQSLLSLDPGLDIRDWPDWGAADDIDFVIVGGRAPGDLSIFPRLKAIQSTWAGVNHLLRSSGLPPDVPIARMVDRGLTESMSEFIVYHVMDELRGGPALRAAQRERRWLETTPRFPRDLTVGILGLGTLGGDAAAKLATIGFHVRGWSRTQKDVPDGVDLFVGAAALPNFCADLDVVVCLLPLTAETENILCADLFRHCRMGALLVNAARGAHLNEADLLAALADGRIGRAVLDVFRTEPLPDEHPFWRHPAITISPHVAAITRAGTGAEDILANFRRAMAGEKLRNEVDRDKGY
ncbi:glyoxylate/hydroxypyruvate reductase A [Dongia mobilis]|uniref:Glyoxylate/hydroxypyruvate reductase A n=1 Tax=Dongia mobilis TaxID=578943 RepID=A0A4R6WL31_9PROT|nr:glyoxylate/hydroxypyruvate reductase A [Dongia mobilis]TDQ81405.1 glyoxylate/hydroxypyruvate reductase A [Dongia mobilis]